MAMNIFRLGGDLLRFLGLLALVVRLRTSKSARAISLGTLKIFALVSVLRYLDLFTTFYSLYNSFLKIYYIIVPIALVLVFRCYEPIKSTYDVTLDVFPFWKLVVIPSCCLATVVEWHNLWLHPSRYISFDFMEWLWMWSICLEAGSMVPQLYLLRNYDDIECLTGSYIFGTSVYRLLYGLNWIYRSHTEPHYRHHVPVYICGAIQSVVGVYIANQLFNKGWSPSGVLSSSIYSQPRQSRRLVEQEGNEIEVQDRRATGLREPLLVV